MADILIYNAFAKGTQNLRVALGEAADVTTALASPTLYATWPSIIPTLPSCAACPVCIYDTSGYFRCGGCCLWTVPAGATKVRFELWGAGSGSGAPYCCGNYPWGPTGAYASVITTAVPGCQYTLCAGCAHSCTLTSGTSTDVSGCPSYVTGYGLTNLCAMGGCGELCHMMCFINPGQPYCRYEGPGQQYWGSCICSGWSSCYSSSCGTNGIIPRTFITDRTFYGTATTGTVYGIPSMTSSDCFDNNNYGSICSPIVMLPNGTVSAASCDSYTSGTCCGDRCQACSGYYLYPGMGGIWTHAMGGSYASGGWGRTGMVKVSWC